jgi:hypothetical protein
MMFLSHVWPQCTKKGNTDSPAKYRPTSSLYTIWFFWMLTRGRLLKVFDINLCDTIYVETGQEHVTYCLLNKTHAGHSRTSGELFDYNFAKWERAFDKVPHQQYFVALERWKVHQSFIEVLDQSYIKVQSGRVPACPEAAPFGAGKQKVSGH